MINNRLERKRETDRKYHWRKKLRAEGIDFDNSLSSNELKILFYEVTNKLPRKKEPKPVKPKGDHLSDQHYSAIEEIEKEEETETINIRVNLPVGVSSLIKDRGNFDQIPLSVIYSNVDIDQWIHNRKKREKEKARKSIWRV